MQFENHIQGKLIFACLIFQVIIVILEKQPEQKPTQGYKCEINKARAWVVEFSDGLLSLWWLK